MEVEIKLALPAREAARLPHHPALAPLRRGPARRQRLVATYFDTTDDRLAEGGVALRIRREGRWWVQAIKGAATAASGGGLAAREEHEWRLRGGTRRPPPDLGRLAEVPLGCGIARIAAGQPLVARFTTQIVRTTLPLSFPDGTMALLAIDVGHVRGARNRRQLAVAEIELELEAGETARLFELAQALAADLPLRVEPRSKAERGYALVAPRALAPRHAESSDYAPDATAGAAFAAILLSGLRQVEGNAEGLLSDDDPEWVHQMRVGARRLRSALTLAGSLLAPTTRADVADELRWLAGSLGAARDLDVFATQTLPTIRDATRHAAPDGGEAIEAFLAPLAEAALHRRKQAQAEARATVSSRRFQRLLLAVAALAASPGHWTHPATGISPSALDFARGVLKRRHRRLAVLGRGLAGRSPEERHAFRIAAKKLRYASEFFAPLFPGGRSRGYRRALSRLQEVLGDLNDASVAAALAAGITAPDTPGAAFIAGWGVARTQHAMPALQRAWKALRAARPFWAD